MGVYAVLNAENVTLSLTAFSHLPNWPFGQMRNAVGSRRSSFSFVFSLELSLTDFRDYEKVS